MQKDQRMKELKGKMINLKEAEMKKELTFTPKTSRSTSNIRSAEEYYNYMKSWKEMKERMENREREIKEEKALDGYTFKPSLNRTSEIMMKNMPSFETRVEKGILNREAKMKEKKSISPCPFKPEIVTRYKKTDLGPVFDRLYPDHIKNLKLTQSRLQDTSNITRK